MSPFNNPKMDLSVNSLPPCFYIEIASKRIEVQCPGDVEFHSEDDVKQWICNHHSYQKAIRDAMQIHLYGHRYCCDDGRLSYEQTKIKERKQLDLLDMISKVQRQFLQSEQKKNVFNNLLEGLLTLTDSEYGFIDELHYEENGTCYAKPNAITNIAWNAATNKFYEENMKSGNLKFTNINSLWGSVVTTGNPVIANDAPNDSRASGIPEGHPPLHSFLGIPIFRANGDIMGVIGVANKPGGYTREDIEYLEPFTITCSNLIEAYWQAKKNEEWIEKLEDMVQERTRKLQLVNESLEKAHRIVVEASVAQLQHFAQMSHEIRTPLTCIVGISSLLQDTSNNLTPMQKEWLEMMVSSGDLLSTVVNELLNYSKLESGNVEIDIEPSSLQETLNSVAHSIDVKSRSKNISIQTYYDTDLPNIICTDSCRLQQILYNLLGNAVKFSKEGGVVELSANLIPNDQYTPSLAQTTLPHHDVNDSHRKDQNNVASDDGSDAKYPPPPSSPKCPFSQAYTNSSPTLEIRQNAASIIEASSVVTSDGGTSVRCSSPSKRPFSQVYANPSPTLGIQQNTACTTKVQWAASCPFSKAMSSTLPVTKATDKEEKNPTPLFALAPAPSESESSQPTAVLQAPMAQPRESITNGRQKQTCLPDMKRSKQILQLRVKDFGQGIETKDFDRIFQPFLQATRETERVYGGTGLGLTITYKLVKGLGGTIRVDSEVGKWSEFTVELPFETTEPVDFEHIKTDLKDTVVVLVEENMNVASRLRLAMERYQVQFAHYEHLTDVNLATCSKDIFGHEEPEKDYQSVVWLVQEDHYKKEPYQDLVYGLSQSPHQIASILLTYGPNYSAKDSKGHFRSLHQILPSVLLKSICTYVLENRQVSKTASPTEGFNNSLCIGAIDNTVSEQLPATTNSTKKCFRDVRVLVADDNLINTKMLSRMLDRLGFQHVDVVDNGKKAVDKEALQEYDVILMDMQMPVMDGVEACRLICARSEGNHPKPKIVFVTANVSSTYEDECAKAGACGFLPKPFNMSDLEKCFRRLTTGYMS